MSGICGVWSLDKGSPNLDSDIGSVLALLERRGPDGTHTWTDGPIALGHTLLATTPEAIIEVLPLTDRDSGCTITADARLDNREELIAALDLAGETPTIGDGELILRSYLKWGDGCPKHLLGDFAFAIWDPRAARFFCARDHMGMRQLIYSHSSETLFAFATEAEALIAHGRVPKRINQARIADFLDDLEDIDFTSTFFEDVFRLPPAHTLIVDAHGLFLRCYWVLSPGPELELASDQAYADAFLAVFTEAVCCRLRSAGPLGSMLSGGIDSNAVTALAAQLLENAGKAPPRIFSAIASDQRDCAESRAIRAAIAHGCFPATLIDHATIGDLTSELAAQMRGNAEPFDGQMTMIRSIYLRAHRDGLKVMLDGVGADIVLTSGNAVARSLRMGSFATAWSIAKARQRFWSDRTETASSMFLESAWVAFVPKVIRRFRRWLIEARLDRALEQGRQIVRPEFAQAINLRLRRRTYNRLVGHNGSIHASDRIRTISRPSLVAGRERYDRVAAALAIEPRDPFLDLRVVEFCVSLPASQLEGNGWPKIILRNAMTGLVSDRVAWRRGKSHLGRLFTETTIGRLEEKPHLDTRKITRYVNPVCFRNTLIDWSVDSLLYFKLTTLTFWLKRIDR